LDLTEDRSWLNDPCDKVPQISQAEMRVRVLAFEQEQLKKPQVEIPVEHNFFPGGYARTIRVPAGTELTGAIHKYQNFNLLVSGELLIIAEDGPMHLKAPAQFWSPPGVKRVGVMLTDVVWTTVLATELTDVDEIKAKFTCNSEHEYLAFIESLKLGVACHSS
jgi:hypothetical protein